MTSYSETPQPHFVIIYWQDGLQTVHTVFDSYANLTETANLAESVHGAVRQVDILDEEEFVALCRRYTATLLKAMAGDFDATLGEVIEQQG